MMIAQVNYPFDNVQTVGLVITILKLANVSLIHDVSSFKMSMVLLFASVSPQPPLPQIYNPHSPKYSTVVRVMIIMDSALGEDMEPPLINGEHSMQVN